MSEYKFYLGDSVYAEFENGMIKLTTDNGYPDDPRNVIYMEQAVRVTFRAWWDRVVEDLKRRHEDATRQDTVE